jgi:Protein of unknown function (DUF4435)
VPFYVSAQALLADVRLRLDALGEESSALVVEGNDDKRLFYSRVCASSDVIPTGGKTLLRSALESMLESDKGRVLFFTDCDYDVASGDLHGGPDIVITASCDVESDLIDLGILDKLAVEVVPQAISSKDSATRIGTNVREHAEKAALPLGRIRMAAQPFGVDLELEEIDFSKYWDKKSKTVLADKLYKVIRDHISAKVGISQTEWDERLRQIPTNPILCHGKDLAKAAQMFFRYLYKMDNKITSGMLIMMMRLAIDESTFESWSVVKRIRAWEARSSRRLLTTPA